MIFETHAHYDDEKFDEDREELLESFQAAGIGTVVNVGASMESSMATIELTKKYPWMYGAVGVHPEECASLTEDDICKLREATKLDKIVAVGEIGLDYYWDEPEREIQKQWFIRQIELARETKLPMIIHSRDAAADTMEILKAQHAEEIGGVIHCFSYSTEMAEEYIRMGFYIGVGGVVTFKKSRKLREVVEQIPLERILLETDCPYLSPEPNRGKRNSSLNLTYIAQEIARIKQVSEEEVIAITEQNAKTMYRR